MSNLYTLAKAIPSKAIVTKNSLDTYLKLLFLAILDYRPNYEMPYILSAQLKRNH